MKSPICTILLSKSEFLFALLLVTFEPHEVEQNYIPHLKALMCGINAAEAQGCECMFTFSHAYSRVPNKRGATFINFRNFVQGVRSYLGGVKYLLRGHVYSFWPKMSRVYNY